MRKGILIGVLVLGALALLYSTLPKGNKNAVKVTADSTNVRINHGLGDYIYYSTPYYVYAWYREFPMLGFFGVESGGRSHHYCERNALRPGLGGRVVADGETSFGKNAPASYEDGVTTYKVIFNNGEQRNLYIAPQGDHQMNLTVESPVRKMKGEFFRIHTAPDIAPVSVWAEKTGVPENDAFETPVTRYTPEVVKACYRLPAVLHFPDYGIMRVECENPDVYLQEHFVPDYENTGLNLGTGNLGGHTVRMAWHLGSVVLSFHSEKPLDAAEIKFTVEDENYPHLPGADMSDPKFNGLKRCWQNVFTVNPSSMTMGDNIQLGGVGHLALTFKSDLLPFTPKLDGTFSMHDALKNSIEKVFTIEGKIGPNNRITDFGWESTEVTLIALYNYLISTGDWPFVKKYINDISRLVKGVLDSDKDNDGIFEAPFHGNRLTSDRESWNWWDDFAFGHKDAYLNLQAYRALGCMKKIYAKLRMQEDVDKCEAAMEKFRGAFHKTFYNPQTGVYAGWISQDGRMHDYMFTFITSMAINEGLVSKADGQKMLRILLNQLAKEGYDYKYGVPGPSMPVAPEDKGTWDEMTRWGRYENGGLCGQAAQHFIQALYEVDMREQADHILFTMLATFEREYTHSGVFTGYVRSVDWRTKGGEPTGYNYLADNYYFLLSAITGHFRIPFPELTDPD